MYIRSTGLIFFFFFPVRHIACNVVFMCTPSEQTENIYQKQLAVGAHIHIESNLHM